jgi:hypothetical protein
MAGDGGRVPDVSEQRAEIEAVAAVLLDALRQYGIMDPTPLAERCVDALDRDGTVAVEDVRARLNEMALVDDTDDPHDEGYMAAVDEMRAWLAGESDEGGR